MKKLILPFFVLLIAVYCGYYLVMEDHPPRAAETPSETNLVLRVAEEGSASECTVAFMENGKVEPLLRTQREKQHLAFLGIPENADFIRINYSVGGGKYEDADFPLEHEPGEHFKMTIDLTLETVEYDITYKDYLLGFPLSEGPLNLLLHLYHAVMYYILWIVFPFVWLVVIYTLFREYHKGLRRRFAGSWVYFAIGCVTLLVVRLGTGFFGWQATWPDLLRTAFSFLMLGYPLYFVAYLVLDENKVLGAEYRLLEEYFTYEEYQLSDGRVANGFVVTWQERGVGGILGWLFGAALLPFSTYARLILYFVTPFMYRSRTWEELTPIEPPGPLALFEKIPSRFTKKEAPKESDAELLVEESAVQEEAAATEGAHTTATATKHRKRKRHRPQRKAPYEGPAAKETGTAAAKEPREDEETLETYR